MITYRVAIGAFLLVCGLGAFGQRAITAEEFVLRTLAAHPLVQAADADAARALAQLKSARAPANPTIELAPGIGATNGNLALASTIDLFGKNRIAARVAAAERLLAEALGFGVRLDAAREALSVYAEVLTAQSIVAASEEGLATAIAIAETVRKRHEIGAATLVQVKRAELDALRAGQALNATKATLHQARTAALSLLGAKPEEEVSFEGWIASSDEGGAVVPSSPSVKAALAETTIAEAKIGLSRASRLPSITAGIVADFWSLDRNPTMRNNTGLQVLLTAPIVDLGQSSNALRAAEADLARSRAMLAEAQRRSSLALSQARFQLDAARSGHKAYREELIPMATAILESLRAGYEAGLVALAEVLEAQQSLGRLKTEESQARLAVYKAEVELLAALGRLPGAEASR